MAPKQRPGRGLEHCKGRCMLDWLGKVLGGDAKGADGVPAAWTQQLKSVLGGADKLKGLGRRGLADDLVGYVLREDPIAVLNEIAQSDEIASLVGLGWFHGPENDGKQARKLYPALADVPPAVVVRWGRVLAASVGKNRSTWSLNLPAGAEWVEALMTHAGGHSVNSWSNEEKPRPELSMDVVEAALESENLPKAALLVACLSTPVNGSYWGSGRAKIAAIMPGFAAAVARNHEAVQPHVLPAAVDQRLHVLEMLGALDGAGLAAFATDLAEHAASGSKQVRAAVAPLVRRAGAALVEPLQNIAVGGKPDQRLYALRMLWTLALDRNDAVIQSWARETALADKAPSVQALPAEWAGKQEARATDLDRYEYAVPTIDWATPLSPALSSAIDGAIRAMNVAIEQSNERARAHHERMKAQGHRWNLNLDQPYGSADIDALRAVIAGLKPTPAEIKRDRRIWQYVQPALKRLAADPAVSPVVLFKLCAAFGALDGREYGGTTALSPFAAGAFDTMRRVQARPTLLELSQMLDDVGLAGGDMILARYTNSYSPIAADWEREAVWPFFAHHLEKLVTAIGSTGRDYWFDRQALYRAVATLPAPPSAVVNAIFDLALGSSRTDRAAAQAALHALQGKEARIINALADGKSEVRAVAAQWLGRLKHDEAIPALEKAVAREKHDVAKGAMLDALQAMGRPVEKYLDRDALETEALKSLAKGLPKDLEWFPWAALPPVHWADSGAQVSPDVLRWLMAQSVRQKSPEPNAVLRKYCAMFTPRDREAFGQFVLEAWLGEDTRPNDPEEAAKLARASANQIYLGLQQYPQYYDASLRNMSLEELVAQQLPGFLRQPAGSAIGSKGLLAVVAACGAERVAAPVQRYLKEWYGTRAAQGKALIAMLAWVEHPSAIQLMLSVGSRFRTKSIQEEATRQAQALADRRGWTLDELADRTIPSAGFDENGEIELSFGPRAFTACLLPDFKIELFNPDGKKIAALPEPRQDDDADRAKDAKKTFTSAKKEIKSIVGLQSERLYEALCTGRDWSFEDWSVYLNRHPVVRHLLQRVVWSVVDSGEVVATFRPLDDGTLTDNEDNAVALSADARVRIAHDTNLPATAVRQWEQHLEDYKIKPLFQQFGKGTWTLPDDKRRETDIMDFEGHLIEAFALRGRATKLGYARGSTGDGGWFMTYEKRFPTLGLVVVIEFTGNPLPEENRTVALLNLRFESASAGGGERPRLALGKVPPVLLSECYNDLRLIAADGTGFDPDWQKKSEY